MNKNDYLEKGEKVRRKILQKLPNNIYQLAKELNKNPSTISYHLNILMKQSKIHYFKEEIDGKLQKIFSIIGLDEEKNTLKLAKALFEVKNNFVFGYALNGNVFGICSGSNSEWQANALWSSTLPIKMSETEIEIKIPKKIMNFYQIPFNTINPSYSEKKDCVLLTF